MEHNVFRDYCKAENSDDEEDNHDLQSRLYAEIYYGSNNGQNVDTKKNIKIETLVIDRNEFHNTTNTPITSNVNDSFGNKQINNDQTETYATNVACDSSLVRDDDKSSIRLADMVATANQPGISYTVDKSNSNVLHVEALEHSQQNNDYAKVKSNLDPQNIPNERTSVSVKSETEVEFINELWSTQDLNYETTTVNHKEYSADKVEATACVKQTIDDDSFDIFKKYEYVKLFINNLYLEKYENINKELEKLEEEKKAILRNEEQEAIVVEEEKRQQDEQSDARMGSTDETENQSKYNIRAKSKKLQGSSNDSEEILLSSDTESDSEVSILEVPIPPKPQPPVINVQDSDDGYEISNSDSDVEYSFNLNNKSPLKRKKKESCSSKSKASKLTVTEDIMLNCTKVQKGASSVQEIIETSRSIHKSSQSPSKDKDSCAKDLSTNVNKINDKNLNRTDKITFVNDKEKSDVQLPLETINNSNTVFERDKTNSVSFVENVNVSNSSELSISRKRHCDDDSGPSNAKRKKGTDNENRYPETNPEQNEDGNKNEEKSWTEYFFRPMSDKLKAFYNESRGQENFDIQEVQSKMSKDPRLWAILDEDLMPGLWKRRFWNIKCNKCNQEGHQAYDCPLPRKLPQCHMCGAPGHTEIRCPQKICLTCGKKQGTFRKTCESCRSLYCDMCKAIGHNSNECPDHWRKFHQTTQVSDINVPDNLSEVMKPADLLYCCNCTKRGHDSSTCHDYQWSQHFRTPAFVTNYAVESSDTNSTSAITQQRDVISTNSYSKNTLTRNVAFPQGKSDLNGCQILFTYGDFQTKKQNGEEFVRKFKCESSHLPSLLKNDISTSMLDQLFKIVKFELKIFRNPANNVMLRIRTALLLSEYVYEFFIYWVKLDDEDKKLHMETVIPCNSKLALKTLTAKMQELKENAYDLKNLYNQLKSLEASAGKTQNPSSNVSNKILDLRRKLLKAFHTKPKLSKLTVRFTRIIERLQVLAKKPKANSTNIKLPMFVEIIIIYNKLFLPRALKSIEFKQLIDSQKYNVEKNKEENNEKSKKPKKKNSPYETFLQNIRNFNINKLNTEKQKYANKNDDTASSSKVIQKEDEQLPAVVEGSSTTNVSLNDGTECNIENDDLQTYNKENAAKRNTGYPIKIVLLQHNQNASGEENNTQSVDNECASFIPLTKPVSYTVTRVENDYLSNISCTKVRPENNTEQQMETSNSTEMIQASTSQQEDDIDVNSGKKKKSKKSRKSRWNSTEPDPHDTESSNTENQTVKPPNITKSRWDSKEPRPKVVANNQTNQPVKAANANKSRWDLTESISKVSGPSNVINQPVIPPDTNMFLENSAAKVINEALVFDLPYMNNAVEEVRKRIINKNIKQEHIDVLRRLIDIEKDHRKFVSAFCNYLK